MVSVREVQAHTLCRREEEGGQCCGIVTKLFIRICI